MDTNDREQIDADVVIVGAGPAGLACAIRLASLISDHNAAGKSPRLNAENVFIIEKASELGGHTLSGAVMDPRALRELIPNFETEGAPLYSKVQNEALLWLTRNRAFRFPFTPARLRNGGNYLISLGRLVQWLGQRAEQAGISIFAGIAGTTLLTEGTRVLGVRTDNKGIGKDGGRKETFELGYDVRARVTVLAEGARGSLTKQLVRQYSLDEGCNPQGYELGIKETWEIPPGRIEPGTVMHTIGHPLPGNMHGGGWIYAMQDNRLSIGLVTALHYRHPNFDPQNAMQRFKLHPFVRRLLEGGKLLQYGAKTIAAGGYWSIPRTWVDGALVIGESAGFLDSSRMKGIHMAIKSGMLAAETVYQALCADDATERTLKRFAEKIDTSWLKDDLWQSRNNYQAFQHGMWRGIGHALIQQVSGGRGMYSRYSLRAAHEYLGKDDISQGFGYKDSSRITN